MKHESLSRRSFLRSSGAVTASSILAASGIILPTRKTFADPPTSGGASVVIPALSVGSAPVARVTITYEIIWTMKDGSETTGSASATATPGNDCPAQTITNPNAKSGRLGTQSMSIQSK